MTTQDLIYRIITQIFSDRMVGDHTAGARLRHRWHAVLATLALCVILAMGVGYLLAELGALITSVGLASIFLIVWVLRDIEVAYLGVIGVICLLPFASFPFNVGFTLTFLDAALGALFFIWILQIATGAQEDFVGTPLGSFITVFVLLAIGAFIVGLSHAPLTPYVLRHFAEVVLSILLFFLIVNTVRDVERLKRIVLMLILGACGAATVGIVLYALASYVSDTLVVDMLSKLARLGYPAGPGVLRYIRDDPSLPMRATSTSVDPNVLGSLLNLTLGISIPQLFARRPLIRRRYLVPILGVMSLCLGLTISRGSMVGLAAALALVATLRYRKLWIWLIVALAILLLLPQTQDLVSHFAEGFQGTDLATEMRMGEYKDALTLIGRYPFLGVGFSGSPDIDTYIGVANVYLLIAVQMGLIGLTSFLVTMAALFVDFWRTRARARARDLVAPTSQLESLWWGLHTGIVGALVGGVFDHYFLNMDFHHSVTLFWLIFGLAAVATRLVKQTEM
ncbi:MAG TPA: O-antigen ligase domain-containing protein [Chloroflexi bacterium]|nr:O-antigen ligase domain-containing protein [Chloroflexota bacterium]